MAQTNPNNPFTAAATALRTTAQTHGKFSDAGGTVDRIELAKDLEEVAAKTTFTAADATLLRRAAMALQGANTDAADNAEEAADTIAP